MAGYIPRNDAEFVDWAANFITILGVNVTTLGLELTDMDPLEAQQTVFATSVTTQVTQQAAARSAVEYKKDQREAFEALIRPMVQRIQHHPGMSDQLRALLGITVPSTSQTPTGAGDDVPSLFLETKPGQVIVHFGTDASNEQHNGKPGWARGCFIYRKKSGETDFSMIAFDTASPYVDTVSGSAVDATYKVAYRGTQEDDIGPMSPEMMIAAGG